MKAKKVYEAIGDIFQPKDMDKLIKDIEQQVPGLNIRETFTEGEIKKLFKHFEISAHFEDSLKSGRNLMETLLILKNMKAALYSSLIDEMRYRYLRKEEQTEIKVN